MGVAHRGESPDGCLDMLAGTMTFDNALADGRETQTLCRTRTSSPSTYGLAIPFGVPLADDAALRIIDEAHQSAERCADDSRRYLNTQMALGLR